MPEKRTRFQDSSIEGYQGTEQNGKRKKKSIVYALKLTL